MTTTVQVSPRPAVMPLHAAWGAAAGVVGGIGMGIWMSISKPLMDTSMIKMTAGLLSSTNAFAGWLIHLAFGALQGQYALKLMPAAVLGPG